MDLTEIMRQAKLNAWGMAKEMNIYDFLSEIFQRLKEGFQHFTNEAVF